MVIEDPKLEVDFVPRIGGALGLSRSMAMSAARPASARTCAMTSDRRVRGRVARSGGFHRRRQLRPVLFAGIDGQVVGRNIFLDGHTDGSSLRVSHRPFAAEAQAGLRLTYRGVRFTYTQVLRTPDFHEQNRYTQFGSINVTFRY